MVHEFWQVVVVLVLPFSFEPRGIKYIKKKFGGSIYYEHEKVPEATSLVKRDAQWYPVAFSWIIMAAKP